MTHLVNAEHLLHEELGVGDDLDFARPLRVRGLESFEQTRVLGNVVGSPTEETGDLDDLALVGFQVDAVAGGAGIAPGRAVDECRDLQDVGRSR